MFAVGDVPMDIFKYEKKTGNTTQAAKQASQILHKALKVIGTEKGNKKKTKNMLLRYPHLIKLSPSLKYTA